MLNPVGIQKILVINLAFIGDVILSTPAVRALEKIYPLATIDMLVVPATAAVAQGNPYIDKVITYDKRGKDKELFRLWGLIKSLRAEKYDLAVAMNFAVRSALVAWSSGARYRLGYDAQHAAHFLTHVASSSRAVTRHETENHLALLEAIGIKSDDTTLEFRLDPETVGSLDAKINIENNRSLVLICPFGRHPLNSWTVSGYIELVRRLADVANCVLIGGQAEKAGLEEINAGAGKVASVLAGVLSIRELAALIDRANLLITVDTGPLHIASAVGTPILGIFGRSDFRIWGPKGSHDVIIHNQTECWPCYRRECSHHRCMRGLKAEKVVQTALNMLDHIRSI